MVILLSSKLKQIILCLFFTAGVVLTHRPLPVTTTEYAYVKNCEKSLYPGQYKCPVPNAKNIYDRETQEYKNCTKENLAHVPCLAGPFIRCGESKYTRLFKKNLTCRHTNGTYLDTALLLSVFLGMMGADRCYLGYMKMGLFKMATLGFFFIGQIIDIVLIATQALPPADGSYYVIPRFGPHVIILKEDRDTYYVKNRDWLT